MSADRAPDKPSKLRRAWQLVLLLAIWRSNRRHKPQAQPAGDTALSQDVDPSSRHVGADSAAELIVSGLFLVSMVCGFAFAVLLILDHNTQLLGLTMGGALVSAGVALALASRRVVPQETAVEERIPFERDTSASDESAEEIRGGAEGITRRRMLAAAAGAAGAGVTAAVAVPVVALGPGLTSQLSRTPWHAGRRLVDDTGRPIAAAGVPIRAFLTAFPEGADATEKEQLTAPLVVIRVDPSMLRLPKDRAHWAPRGIMAFSKICTHAGCAISLFRAPLNPSTAPSPALVCPCHYSTFDVLDGGSVEFGPAGRPLPQLPLVIDGAGNLRAGGPMSGPVGPSWWGDPR
jgi:ubiquinol-cytochrome c reductase iron-sulfur subunit